MEHLSFSYNDLVIIGTFLISVSGLYWRMVVEMKKLDARQASDIKMLDLKITEIQCDRKDKWAKHDEKQDKTDAVFDVILKSLADIRGDVKEVKTNIDWLKKK